MEILPSETIQWKGINFSFVLSHLLESDLEDAIRCSLILALYLPPCFMLTTQDLGLPTQQIQEE